jgi:hypothetical protein
MSLANLIITNPLLGGINMDGIEHNFRVRTTLARPSTSS